MDSALLSAAVAMFGVVAGGVGTYLTTSKATAKTLRVQTENAVRELDAAHGQKLQDLQAPAYEQAIAALKHRRDEREHDLNLVRWDEHTERVVRTTLNDYRPPNWYESQSRLELYASQGVLAANEVANQAHERVLGLAHDLADLREAVNATDPTDRAARAAFGGRHAAIFRDIQEALKEAASADDDLIQLMRTGVHTRPSQYLLAPSVDADGLGLEGARGSYSPSGLHGN